jgi:hypothetical protein
MRSWYDRTMKKTLLIAFVLAGCTSDPIPEHAVADLVPVTLQMSDAGAAGTYLVNLDVVDDKTVVAKVAKKKKHRVTRAQRAVRAKHASRKLDVLSRNGLRKWADDSDKYHTNKLRAARRAALVNQTAK